MFSLLERKFAEYFCKIPPKKGQRGDVVKRGRGCPHEVDELSCVPETQQSQQAARVEVVVRVEDPLVMSDTEQNDIALETQQDLDSSDQGIADTKDTQAAGGTQKGKGKGKGKSRTRERGATCITREG